MKRTRYIALLATLLTCFIHYGSMCAIQPDSPVKKPKKFFSKNTHFPLYIEIKSSAQLTLKTIQKYYTANGKWSIGPMIEWRFLNGIGIQTGLLYSYNIILGISLATNKVIITDKGLLYIFNNFLKKINDMNLNSVKDYIRLSPDGAMFHALYIPLFLRIYPDKNRQFVLYGGVCFLLKLFGCQLSNIPSIYLRRGLLYKIVKDGWEGIISHIFKDNAYRLSEISRYSWDFGFEFIGKSGVIVGINWIGMTLGYDCSKFLFKKYARSS